MAFNISDFKTLSLAFGNLNIKLAQIENPELLFDELLKKNEDDVNLKDERIPYWAELWPSAIGMSEFLSENIDLVKGKTVIEIGCGLGLAGIVTAKLGAHVILTDYLQGALDFAAYNWKLNFNSVANVLLLDWRLPVSISPVDVLIASDVAYESRSFKPLIKTIKALVKSDGLVLISEPNRKFASEFFNEIKKEGFKVTSEMRNVVKDGLKYKISIYVLKLKKAV